MMAARLPIAAIWALLVLALLLSPLLGLLTPYVSLLIVVPVFAATLARGQLRQAYATYEARAFLAVFLVLAVICAVTADSASDVLRALNFTMLLAYGPLVLLMRRHAGRVGVERVAQLAALGVAIGLAEVALSVALPDIRYLHYDRPTGPDIGPIVLSNGLLALGFIASGAVLLGRDGRSWLYLLAPLAAIIATLITGSRGPLIGVPVAVLVAALFVWRIRFGGSRRAGWVGLGGLALVGIAGAAVVLRGRAGSIIDIAGSLFGGGTVVDESTRQRLALYDAGSKSFVESPWIGHGWGNIMESVRPLLSASNASLADLPPDAGEGNYTVSWTVVEVDADEDHAVNGEFSFTVDSSAPPVESPTVAVVAPTGTQEPIDDASTTIPDSDDSDDSGIGRGALIVGGVTILVALAVVATVGRRRTL